MGRKPRRRIGRHEEAATQAISLLMAGMILTGGVGTILYESREQKLDVKPDDYSRNMEAAIMLDMLLDSQGVGWDNGVDSVDRVGLATSDGGLDFSSLLTLRTNLLSGVSVSGQLDHDEMVGSMGLDPEAYGMQLRLTPKILREDPSVQREFSSMRTALIADWTNIVEVRVSLGANESQMVAQSRQSIDASMADGAAKDRQTLRAMGLEFRDRVHLTGDMPQILVDLPFSLFDVPLRDTLSDVTLLQGDVYPDDKDYLPGALGARLHEYELLVIGSGADHQALHDGKLKKTIQDWVEAGGNLVILGSPESTHAWLTPLFAGASFETGLEGPMTASTPSHGALTRPDGLQWNDYAFPGTAWRMSDVHTPGHSDFTHPLQANGHSVLAISEPGTFGEGSIAFTSLPVSVLFDAGGVDEASRFLTNVLVYTALPWVERLTIVFGEPVPEDQPVGFAYRSTQAEYPGHGIVAIDAELLLWKKPVPPPEEEEPEEADPDPVYGGGNGRGKGLGQEKMKLQ